MEMKEERLSKGWRTFIWVVSISLPGAIAAIGAIPKIEIADPQIRSFFNNLPTFYASINAMTFFLLLGAFAAIRKKNIALHKKLITVSMLMSAIFLISYVAYHITTPHTTYGGEGTIRIVYFTILNSHILLSAVIVPLVLVSYARGLSMMVARHKKIARIALPLWLYVAASGVAVYVMISPYYQH
jgi:putative membrane protein